MVIAMPEWNVGDRVVSTANHPDGNPDIVVGFVGTVCAIADDRVGICWDEPIENGHDCTYDGEGRCEYGHGWWVYEDQIEPEADDDTTFEFDEDEFNKLVFGAADSE